VPIEFSDLVDNHPLDTFVELKSLMLASVATVPTGAPRSRALLKKLVLSVANYGTTAYEDE
jgi:hypothetical protein